MKRITMNNGPSITLRETESFKKYLSEISQIEKLTVDEEYQISLKAAQGDENAINELVRRNLRFVISVAKQYATPDTTLEDLVNEGNYGLVQAARKYDPSKGFKFITYAVWWIRRSIIIYISDKSRMIRLPTNKVSTVSKIKTEMSVLEQKLGREPSYDEMMEMTGDKFTPEEIDFYIFNENQVVCSLDTPFGDDEGDFSYNDVIEGSMSGPSDQALRDEDSEMNINRLLSYLKNDKERAVITMLFGLDGNEPLNPNAVGDIMGFSRERVRQIKEKALKVFRKKI